MLGRSVVQLGPSPFKVHCVGSMRVVCGCAVDVFVVVFVCMQ